LIFVDSTQGDGKAKWAAKQYTFVDGRECGGLESEL
jgi:hypothetical protein